jgi:hypothetical protein
MKKTQHFLLLALLSCALACHKPDANLMANMETARAYYQGYYPNTEMVGSMINKMLLKMADMPTDFAQNKLIQDLQKNTLALRETYSKAQTSYSNSLNSLTELKKAHGSGNKSKAEAEIEFKTLEATLIEAKKQIEQYGQELRHNMVTYDIMFAKYKENPVGFEQYVPVIPADEADKPRHSLEVSPDGRGFVRPK